MSSAAETSHGRGGAGNIAADNTEPVKDDELRSGQAGSHGNGAFSAGRGGAGNIVDAGTAPMQRKDQDAVPAAAAADDHQDFHTGRGGFGNEHTSLDRDRPAGRKSRGNKAESLSLADKLKHKLLSVFKK